MVDRTFVDGGSSSYPNPLDPPAIQHQSHGFYYQLSATSSLANPHGGANESQLTPEDIAFPHYGTGYRRRDPDGDGELPACGDEVSRLEPGFVRPEGAPQDLADFESAFPEGDPDLAPYRIVGQGTGFPPYRFLYYHLDHLGTVRVITDHDGHYVSEHHYLPFGDERPAYSDGTVNTRQFTGHERDAETGLDYMLARYYSSSLGRFMAVDPALKIGKNLGIPQRWNRYTYALNNPLAFVDLDGRDVTVAANARRDVAYAYQHSAEFRSQFNAAKNNPDVKVTLMRVPTVTGARADADLAVEPKELRQDPSGKQTATRNGVEGTAHVPERRGGDLVLGAEAAGLFGHELAHVNNLATAKETTAGAQSHSGPGEPLAQESEDKIRNDLTTKSDDISVEETEKALAGTEPKKKDK